MYPYKQAFVVSYIVDYAMVNISETIVFLTKLCIMHQLTVVPMTILGLAVPKCIIKVCRNGIILVTKMEIDSTLAALKVLAYVMFHDALLSCNGSITHSAVPLIILLK